MAIAKVIYKESSSATGEVWMDVTQKTVTSATMLSDITALKNDGTGVIGNIALKSVTNLRFSSSTATFVVPSGYYSGAINWTIASKGAETFTPAETAQTISSYQWLTGSQTIAAISSTYVGTAIPRQGVGGLAIDGAGVIFADAGYYSETVSRNMSTVSAKTITPTESIQRAVSSHYFTTGHISVAAISSTYVGTGVSSIGATTIYPSTSAQVAVSSGTYTTGDITVGAVALQSKTVTPTESAQTITPDPGTAHEVSPDKATQLSSNPLVTTIDLSFIEYGKKYRVTGNITYTTDYRESNNIVAFDTVWTASEDGDIDFSITSGTSVYASRITLSKTQLKIYLPAGTTISRGDIANGSGYYNTITFTSIEDSYIGLSSVLVNGISSTYVGTGVPIGAVDFSSGLATVTFTATEGYYSSAQSITLTGRPSFTIVPSTIDQYINSGVFITGSQTIKGVTFRNIEASYIASGTTIQVGYDGYSGYIASVTGTFKGPESFASIYKSLAYRSQINSNHSLVSEWANSLSYISYAQFAGQPFSGSFTFGNVSYISEYGFACPYTNYATGLGTVNFSFPECTRVEGGAFTKCGITINNLFLPKASFLSTTAFMSAKIYNISAPLCVELGASAFAFCSNITSIYLPSCSLILNGALNNAWNLGIASFPSCESIYGSAFYSCSKLSSISFPNCKIIGMNAFGYCASLTEAYFPLCELISSTAFYACTNLISANFPKCSIISTGAFSNCSKLTTISFPLCELISSTAFCWCSSLVTADFSLCQCISTNAFSACYNLQSISFPVCSRIERSAFYSCKSLSSVYFPQCSFIGNSAFQGCSVLTTVNFPACLSIESDVFSNCSALTYASFPICTIISQNVFWGTALQSIDFPSCTYVGPQAFSGCSSLSIASLINCTSFRENVFRSCVQLISLYLGSSIPIFGTNMFNYTPISTYSTVAGRFGSIYVPSSMLNSYKTATNWATYSSKMVGY